MKDINRDEAILEWLVLRQLQRMQEISIFGSSTIQDI